jgi:hypothetical protein
MTKLNKLHRRLASLRRRRVLARWSSAYAALITATLWTLAVALAIDLAFELNVAQRLVVFAFCGGAMVWAFRRFALPLLGIRETEIQLALQVESQHQINSDLVAAIQFERPEAAGWGSRQLEEIVIDKVAAAAHKMDVSKGLVHGGQMARRVTLLLLTAALIGGLVHLFPDHARIFARRLCLAPDHYPSTAVIERVVVGDQTVLQRERDGTSPSNAKSAESFPLTFQVHCSGRLPKQGTAQLRSASGQERSLELEHTATDGTYSGRLNRLVEPFTYQIYLGDAWTDPARVEMIPLPVVQLQMTPSPPSYAAAGETAATDPAARQISILEGSSVGIAVQCTNRERIDAAWLTVTSQNPPCRYELTQTNREGTRRRLDADDSPFAQVTEEIRFELQVKDEDGLQLESPIRGYVRIKADRPPFCSADVIHRVVLPTARPVIQYRANDDYGIASLVLNIEIERGDPDADQSVTLRRTVPLPEKPLPLPADRLPVERGYTLDLASLQVDSSDGLRPAELVQGDRLKLTVRALDFRGELPGQSYLSDPLILEISDESGVLSAITEADERTEERLTDIIKQQLGIGE